jgi:hypothetical protein
MTAGKYDIIIERGADFNFGMTLYDSSGALINLTGYSAAMMVRNKFSDPSPLLSLVSGAAITLGGSAGTIAVFVPGATTLGLSAGIGVYDLILTAPGGQISRLVEGSVSITPQVTHA